jgi:hypothetical protein
MHYVFLIIKHMLLYGQGLLTPEPNMNVVIHPYIYIYIHTHIHIYDYLHETKIASCN